MCGHNRKSKDGSCIAIVTEDMKLSYIVTESLSSIRTLTFPWQKLRLKENSKITSISFKLNDTVLLGYSDGSIIKSKYNEEPLNLIFENRHKKTVTSDEEEFENIQSVFSTDLVEHIENTQNTNDNSYSTEVNPVEYLLVSNRYKIVFSIIKYFGGLNKVNLYCLRNNRFERFFCKLDGVVNSAKLIDKKDLMIVVTMKIETKHSTLEIWNYNENQVPVAIYDLSSLLPNSFTVRAMSITQMPNRYYGRNTNHGIVDGDMIFLGTTKGDVILAKICPLQATGKIGFDPLYIYKLKNDSQQTGEEMSNKFEVSFVSFDLYFDVLILGDVSSNVRFFEKILQIGKNQSHEDNLPFFSFFGINASSDILSKDKNEEFNLDLPLFSVNHDVIKDRSIIVYDQGRDLIISNIQDENYSTNYDSSPEGKAKTKIVGFFGENSKAEKF